MLTTTIEFLETQLDEQKTVLATSDGGGGGTNAASGIDLNTIPSTPVQHWRVTKQIASIVVMARRTGGASSTSTPLAAEMGCTPRTSPRTTAMSCQCMCAVAASERRVAKILETVMASQLQTTCTLQQAHG